MALKEDLVAEVDTIFRSGWTKRKGQVVPEPEDLKLQNDAVTFDRATVLYADLSGSTSMVDKETPDFSSEIYKTYLFCAAKLIRDEGGVITSYDGDRVMGVFIGDSQTTPAARCALKINYAVGSIINAALSTNLYAYKKFQVRQVVGIDTSPIQACRTGVRGGNDIVWVGRAANYAAKLTAMNNSTIRSWVTKEAYDHMLDEVKFGGADKKPMWEKFTWNDFGNKDVYGSSWTWSF